MTSEVVIMNMNAPVLAADSAATVSEWAGGKFERRYFKGTNKILQLSNHQPVGAMIYGNADLEGMPWELLIKNFRSTLGSSSFPTIEEYFNRFVKYLEDDRDCFPDSVRNEVLKDSERVPYFAAPFLTSKALPTLQSGVCSLTIRPTNPAVAS